MESLNILLEVKLGNWDLSPDCLAQILVLSPLHYRAVRLRFDSVSIICLLPLVYNLYKNGGLVCLISGPYLDM